jgi:hypothetical protein
MHCNCETSDGWSARKMGSGCFLEVAPAVHICNRSDSQRLYPVLSGIVTAESRKRVTQGEFRVRKSNVANNAGRVV